MPLRWTETDGTIPTEFREDHTVSESFASKASAQSLAAKEPRYDRDPGPPRQGPARGVRQVPRGMRSASPTAEGESRQAFRSSHCPNQGDAKLITATNSNNPIVRARSRRRPNQVPNRKPFVVTHNNSGISSTAIRAIGPTR